MQQMGNAMQSIHVELPDTLAAELDALMQTGWFLSKNELICLALVEFARRHRLALAEQFQQEDIAWALRQKEATQE
jgi:Arc/MetJ-type ribon-helix-helix transcriptional regulator